eukprot:IDg13009t1
MHAWDPPLLDVLSAGAPRSATHVALYQSLAELDAFLGLRASAPKAAALSVPTPLRNHSPLSETPLPSSSIVCELYALQEQFRDRSDHIEAAPLLSPACRNNKDAASASSCAASASSCAARVGARASRHPAEETSSEHAADHAHHRGFPTSVTAVSPALVRTRKGRVTKSRKRVT